MTTEQRPDAPVITGDELAGALTRRYPDMFREDAARLSRLLVADAVAHREPAGEPMTGAADPVRAAVLDGMLITALGERADRAEEKLAALRAVLLEGGQDNATVRRRALAIIGSEEAGGACACGQEECRG